MVFDGAIRVGILLPGKSQMAGALPSMNIGPSWAVLRNLGMAQIHWRSALNWNDAFDRERRLSSLARPRIQG